MKQLMVFVALVVGVTCLGCGGSSEIILPTSTKAKETGAEVIEIGMREFNTTIFEWEESNETGPMTVKLWRSDEIPGKILRQELFTKSTSTKSFEEVTELNLGN